MHYATYQPSAYTTDEACSKCLCCLALGIYMAAQLYSACTVVHIACILYCTMHGIMLHCTMIAWCHGVVMHECRQLRSWYICRLRHMLVRSCRCAIICHGIHMLHGTYARATYLCACVEIDWVHAMRRWCRESVARGYHACIVKQGYGRTGGGEGATKTEKKFRDGMPPKKI